MDENRRSSPSKKRKIHDANDATYVAPRNDIINTGINNDGNDSQLLSSQRDESNIMAKLDRMEQMIMTLVEKQATVSNLESRCEQLERKCSSLENTLVESNLESRCEKLEGKCSSLENKLEARLDSMQDDLVDGCSKLDKIEKQLEDKLENKLEDKIDSLRDRARHYHEHTTMLVKNQSWEYSAEIADQGHYRMQGHDHDDAEHLVDTAEMLKGMTMKMRRGEFPHDCNGRGIHLRPYEDYYHQYDGSVVFQHWKEFAAALKQFHPVISLVPEEVGSFFGWGGFRMNRTVTMLVKNALIGAPFQNMVFYRNIQVEHECGGLNVNDILVVTESNKRLQHLEIRLNRIRYDHIDRICSVVHNHTALKELTLMATMAEAAGVGNSLLRALCMRGDLKLRKLSMFSNAITSDVSTSLADFIASNPILEELNLESNELTENDAILLANALRTNTTLQCLKLEGNFDITESGISVIRSVVCDQRSLNTFADSNHCCCLSGLHKDLSGINKSEVMKINRGKKIYSLLCYRNIFESNIPHFSDIDVKMLPDMLAAIQGCTELANKELRRNNQVGCLSMVYEVMRKWEKVFNVYESLAM